MKYYFSKHKSENFWWIVYFKDEKSPGIIIDDTSRTGHGFPTCSVNDWIMERRATSTSYDSLEELTAAHFEDIL